MTMTLLTSFQECDNDAFNVISRRSTLDIVVSRKMFFFKILQGGKQDYSRYLKLLLLAASFYVNNY